MSSASATLQLADYAHGMTRADLPSDVLDLAETCLIDAVACAVHGARFPWSQILRDQVLAARGAGTCRMPLLDLPALPADQMALLGGAFAHAFELDSLRSPGAGVHPGATVALPALAVAQQVGASPEALLRAIVAGVEVMFRIGNATLHSAEGRGFHAPGLTGPFGAAVATAVLRELAADQIASAIGIAASTGGGLLAFAAGHGGGMVKRLHLGRAAQGGVFAADLAERGYEGPAAALEGRFGLLEAYCPESDASRLTEGLGSRFEIRRLCVKRYACHVTAQAPVEFLQDAMAEHGFAPQDIASIELGVSDKVRSNHADPRPSDMAGAQYSVPCALAMAAYGAPDDPLTFEYDPAHKEIGALAQCVSLHPQEGTPSKWGAEVVVRLKSGAVISGTRTCFLGMPERPFTPEGRRRKFKALTGRVLSEPDAATAWLLHLGQERDQRSMS